MIASLKVGAVGHFTGFIGQMGTQFDALAHQGRYVRMADGSAEAVFYNGFMETQMMGPTNGSVVSLRSASSR